MSVDNIYTIEDFNRILTNDEDYINVTEDGGVKKRIIKEGSGDGVKPGDYVEVHYSAYHSASIIAFDSTHLRNRTFSVDVPENYADLQHTSMCGIIIGVASMKLFEESFFILRPKYAMGVHGCYPRVPPNATCFVTITVVSVGNFSYAQEYESLPMSEKRYAEYDIFESAMLKRKHQAKLVFKNKNYQRAIEIYKKALNHTELYSAKDEYYDLKRNKILVDIENNIALCYILLNMPAKVMVHTKNVLRVDNNNVKALFYKAKASRLNGDLSGAEKNLKLAKKLSPHNTEIDAEFSALENVMKISFNDSKNILPYLTAKDKIAEGAESKGIDYRKLISKSVAELIEATIQRFINEECMETFAFTGEYFDDHELKFVTQIAEENNLIHRQSSKQDNFLDEAIVHISKRNGYCKQNDCRKIDSNK